MIVDLLLLFWLIFQSPKMLYERLRGKRHPAFFQRLGFFLPTLKKEVIWLHAVSVGEIKAAQPLFKLLKKEKSNSFFLITTTTATGQAEARRSLKEADLFLYLPLDFQFAVKRFIKKIRPQHFILVESDFWPNLLRALKKNGTKISLVSGKISERSARRFRYFYKFSNRLFSCFDHICVQNEEHFHRFQSFLKEKEKLWITGNLKFDLESISEHPHQKEAICISCTHPKEEGMILEALKGVDCPLYLAPRHPERFSEVESLLKQRKITFSKYSEKALRGKIVLIDQMGVLNLCYQKSLLVILGGSFVPHIGGHNVLEPCLYGAPVIFGPYMWGQTELTNHVLKAQGGIQADVDHLRETVDRFLQSKSYRNHLTRGALKAVQLGQGAALQTFKKIV